MKAADAWRALYAAAPEDFVKERDRLAKELKAAGDADGAAALKKARKPGIPVWALNQVAQHQRELLEELVEAGAAMASVHDALARGQAAGDFKTSSSSYRQAIAAVVGAARDVLEQAGHGADAGTMRRIERTLEAVPFVDEAKRTALRQGHLGEELSRDEAGDGLALEAALMASAPEKGEKAAPKASRPAPPLKVVARTKDADADDAARREALRDEARRRRGEADDAAREATVAAAAASKVTEALARARADLEEARAEVASIEEALSQARARAEAARREAANLDSDANAATRRASEARKAADRAEAAAAQAEARAPRD